MAVVVRVEIEDHEGKARSYENQLVASRVGAGVTEQAPIMCSGADRTRHVGQSPGRPETLHFRFSDCRLTIYCEIQRLNKSKITRSSIENRPRPPPRLAAHRSLPMTPPPQPTVPALC